MIKLNIYHQIKAMSELTYIYFRISITLFEIFRIIAMSESKSSILYLEIKKFLNNIQEILSIVISQSSITPILAFNI